MDEIAFAFESDGDEVLRLIGISDDVEEPYWVGRLIVQIENDLKKLMSFLRLRFMKENP
ncbi:hypothetical protein [Streptococcus halotolerans]